MDVYDAVARRCSVRAYEDKPIEQDKLDRVLEAGRVAPTARNRQEFRAVVVRDAGLRAKLAEAAGQEFIAQAPVVIAMVGLTPDATMHCEVPTDPVDCAIIIDHMTLAAVAEGLGTCWIGHFEQDACRKILGIPDTAKIIELLPMGYPAGPPKMDKPRKPLDEIVSYDKFA